MKIIRKNKDYASVEQAQVFYEKKRLTELATTNFLEEWYHPKFRDCLIRLMKFQNPVQMQVWHNKNERIKDENGNRIPTTWETMCYFSRKFNLAEMYQCLEILKRATPNECANSDIIIKFNDSGLKLTKESILEYFNEIAYPEIEEIVNHMQKVLDEVEEQICAPIRAKINSDLKIMMQLPLGDTTEFIKAKDRRM